MSLWGDIHVLPKMLKISFLTNLGVFTKTINFKGLLYSVQHIDKKPT